MDVHARDVAAALASDAGVPGDPTAFAWTSQLRQYWVAAGGGGGGTGSGSASTSSGGGGGAKGDVVLRMMNASVAYGYEYLGNRCGGGVVGRGAALPARCVLVLVCAGLQPVPCTRPPPFLRPIQPAPRAPPARWRACASQHAARGDAADGPVLPHADGRDPPQHGGRA